MYLIYYRHFDHVLDLYYKTAQSYAVCTDKLNTLRDKYDTVTNVHTPVHHTPGDFETEAKDGVTMLTNEAKGDVTRLTAEDAQVTGEAGSNCKASSHEVKAVKTVNFAHTFSPVIHMRTCDSRTGVTRDGQRHGGSVKVTQWFNRMSADFTSSHDVTQPMKYCQSLDGSTKPIVASHHHFSSESEDDENEKNQNNCQKEIGEDNECDGSEESSSCADAEVAKAYSSDGNNEYSDEDDESDIIDVEETPGEYLRTQSGTDILRFNMSRRGSADS